MTLWDENLPIKLMAANVIMLVRKYSHTHIPKEILAHTPKEMEGRVRTCSAHVLTQMEGHAMTHTPLKLMAANVIMLIKKHSHTHR